MRENITKNQAKEYLNNHHWINGYAKINSNDNLELSIILGEPMAKKSKLDMILEEMREGFRAVNARLDKVEADVAILKQDMIQVKQDIVELKRDVALIKQCPTIKKELELISNN